MPTGMTSPRKILILSLWKLIWKYSWLWKVFMGKGVSIFESRHFSSSALKCLARAAFSS
jgi:hypothetical protein